MPWAVDGVVPPHWPALPHREGPRTHPADAEGTATHLTPGSPRRRAQSCSATRLAGAAAASDMFTAAASRALRTAPAGDYADAGIGENVRPLRIVHPVEAGVYGRRVRGDLDLSVETGGTIFENLTFTSDPDEENFFEADIDRDENAGGEETQ